MDRYDIFERFPNGRIEWRTFLPELRGALVLLTELGKLYRTEFFAYRTATKEIVARVNGPVLKRAVSG